MRLTIVSKVLIGVTIVAGGISAIVHLNKTDSNPTSVVQEQKSDSSQTGGFFSSMSNRIFPTGNNSSGPIGSKERPLVVSIVDFHGYAPALVANGGSLTTQPGSTFDKLGLNVKFQVQNDVPTLATLFGGNQADCAWRTSDFWAQEQPNLREKGLDGRAVMVVDNTQGADVAVTFDPSIRSVEDLPGHTVGLLQFSPSHGLTVDMVNNSSLTARNKGNIKYVYVNAEEGTAGVRNLLKARKIDVGVLWDPDASLVLREPGAHSVFSTKQSSNLIYDVQVCSTKVIDSPEGAAAVQKFVTGWMQGVKQAKADPQSAVNALVATEDTFKMLKEAEDAAGRNGNAFIQSLFGNLVWTGIEDNARILGIIGETDYYSQVYTRFANIYRSLGALANPNSPPIAPSDSFDYRFIKSVIADNQAAVDRAKSINPEDQFNKNGLQRAVKTGQVSVTKPVTVNFATGSYDLDEASRATIDHDMVEFINSNGKAYFVLSGNTDSVGLPEANNRLSKLRAQSVKSYLVREWGFSPNRFEVVGNGSRKPICNETNPSDEGISLDECRTMNRSTRLAVLSVE